jgi:hypothetical protein
MIDTEKICRIVKIPYTEGLDEDFSSYCANMFNLFKPIQGVRLNGHATLNNSEPELINYKEIKESPVNFPRELALSNGQTKGTCFVSSRAVGV